MFKPRCHSILSPLPLTLYGHSIQYCQLQNNLNLSKTPQEPPKKSIKMPPRKSSPPSLRRVFRSLLSSSSAHVRVKIRTWAPKNCCFPFGFPFTNPRKPRKHAQPHKCGKISGPRWNGLGAPKGSTPFEGSAILRNTHGQFVDS